MQVSIQEANAAKGSMDFAYYGIILKGFYMPKRRCTIIKREYLYKVMTNKLFRIKQSDVKVGQLIQKSNCQELWHCLLGIQVQKPWAIDEDHLPDKIWLINALFILNPSHPKSHSSIPNVNQFQLKKILGLFNLLIHLLADRCREDFQKKLRCNLKPSKTIFNKSKKKNRNRKSGIQENRCSKIISIRALRLANTRGKLRLN